MTISFDHGQEASQPNRLDTIDQSTGKFNRLFPSLPPLRTEPYKLRELGEAMKANDIDIQNSGDPGDNKAIESGYMYLGQFIDHDISFDTTSLGERLLDPNSIANFRTPALDLDSIYGLGPNIQPYLYKALSGKDELEKFIFGMTRDDRDGSFPNDLPRAFLQTENSPESIHCRYALIPDVRNDSHVILAQMHLAWMKFHNKIVDDIHHESLSINQNSPIHSLLKSTENRTFELARKVVLWHYHWIILNEYLPKVVNSQQLELVLNFGRDYYTNLKAPFLPLEFSAGVFRFSHSTIRPFYQLNGRNKNGDGMFSAMQNLDFFTGKKNHVPLPTSWMVDWRHFFQADPAIKPNYSRLIDPSITNQLYEEKAVGPTPLIVMDFLRGCKVGLPSGQSVAKYMGFKPLEPDKIASGVDGAIARKYNLHLESPLLYYILKEAKIQQQGQRLGDVGSRIVAEVIIGLLETDPNSYITQDKTWKPNKEGDFKMVDMLKYADVLEKPFKIRA